jgi:hypothetical protein
VQGYFTGYPMSAAELEHFLERRDETGALGTVSTVWQADQKSPTPWLAP